MAEAAHAIQLVRVLGRRERLDLIRADELGGVPLADCLTDRAPIITAGIASCRFRRMAAQCEPSNS